MHPLNLSTSAISIVTTIGSAYCSIARYTIKEANDAYSSIINVPLRLFAFNEKALGLLPNKYNTGRYVCVARENELFGPELYNPYFAFGVPIDNLIPLLNE